jgi:hypothetical protein
MTRLRGNVVRATWGGLVLALVLWGATASAEQPQGRPGVIRIFQVGGGDRCSQTTDTYGNFRDVGPEIPCDDHYKDGEEIAWWEFLHKTDLKVENSPGHRANWEAWQASAASGATTTRARLAAYDAEQQKQTEQHTSLSQQFVDGGRCEPDKTGGKDYTCEEVVLSFQRDYWLALQGDHQAQDNVAYCFEVPGPQTGPEYQPPCHGVPKPNATMQCAWYLVAASSGHPESAKSAENYHDNDCDKQPLYVRQAILGTASELFQRIYNRSMPVAQ